jgi:hypothetical protein
MDYLVEVSPDQFYGPTTWVQCVNFSRWCEINGRTMVTNCRDGSEIALKIFQSCSRLLKRRTAATRSGQHPINLQQRIRELEEIVLEERRARETAEHLVEKLEAKLAEINRAASCRAAVNRNGLLSERSGARPHTTEQVSCAPEMLARARDRRFSITSLSGVYGAPKLSVALAHHKVEEPRIATTSLIM